MAKKGKFPTFAWIVLVLGILWLLGELGIFAASVPWLPIILIIVAIGWLVDRYKK
ncbi:MAG: hypothetical protein KKH88_03805 [Nanoarchaeota archaeon]|nr:hypothetical protein [Nanoarchaeota archaeon]MBU1445517.1 hypothetical protein [Nanoarchaeota archaeon]MBU2420616.1 hypothetical protein [Nanoarchaeota archaeon]MBU2474936.1 hypothetical protein [Nanoarchaeota archaeon]MBU3941024.1 hypothetical protein [Nanoarchaeota archaeon]